MAELVLLSIIQGVTEFLPISSSAHLFLFSNFLNFNNEDLTLDVSLHLGSLIAILFYFRREIKNFILNKNLFFLVIISSFPTLLIGFFLINNGLIYNLRNITIIGYTTLIFGLILYVSDLKSENKKIENNFNFNSAIFIGFFQILSLIPGVSRSGITITAARFLGFKRTDSAKISFLLSIPTLAAIGIYNIYKLILTNNNYIITIQNNFGILLAFIFSYITIKYFVKYLSKFSLFFFVVYRILLGIIILLYVYN